ncbi:probable flavin-containing monoamine oxidase A [Scleropages formosus]|uniref:Amine oxidase n=1 Tax=Scleropages formosus TaxID=113540 RepID=A0A8C9R9U7_SCLFO|nr:probable flavin-containing monoamine oxidase A [Scleropages formosus]
MSARSYDVVIVGAGLSGLSAARHLLKKNSSLRVLLLEGKDRVGGRTMSSKLPAAQGKDVWDLGGQWVGSSQMYVMDLIRELGLETYPQYTAGKKVYHMGGPRAKVRTYTNSLPSMSLLTLLDLKHFQWQIDRMSQSLSMEDPTSAPRALEYDSMTLSSYMDKKIWTQSLRMDIELCTRSLFGMEPSQISFLYFLMYCRAAGGILHLLETTPGSAQESRIKGGTQQLSEKLADQIGRENIHLNSAVLEIQQGPEGAVVRTRLDTFSCRAVIVTCPPHLAAQIQYVPALPPARQRLTQSMPVGHMIKFIVTYRTAFWRTNGFSGEIVVQPSSDCPFCITFDATSPRGNPGLVGFISGAQANDWSYKTVEDRRDAVIQSLVKYLGPEASDFIHYAEKDWAKEEYNGGCPVNVMVPGMLTYYHPSLRRPCGRIHWAGTETATHWCGYMSGAIQSGLRAALEVLERLSPKVLSQEELQEAQASTTHTLPHRSWDLAPQKTYLPVCLTVTTVTLGVALLLANPCLYNEMIEQGSAFLQKFGFWC